MKLSKKASEHARARVRFLRIGNLTIEPRAGKYYIEGLLPSRIGDQVYISFPPVFGIYPPKRQLTILLADASGRRWLVACG